MDLGTLSGTLTMDAGPAERTLAGFERRVRGFADLTQRQGERAGKGLGEGFADAAEDSIKRGGAGLERQAQSIGRRMGTGMSRAAGSTLSAAGRAGGFLGKAALGLGAAGALGLAAVGVAGGAMGLEVASGNEQARISFTTMLGSAERADSFLREMQKFAATTPFEFPELQTAASSLISAGIESSKVIPIMRTLGDVTSGMGTGSEGVQRATVALQQMSAAGRITGEDLNQLRDAGIPVYDLLAKATGKSKAEVVKLAQAGKLGKTELDLMMKALESGAGLERFSGLMDKQSKSLAGMASTLKDTVGQGLANALAPTFPMLVAGLNSVSNTLGKVFGWISDNRESFTKIFDTASAVVGSFGRIAKGAILPFIDSLSAGQGTFADFADYISEHQGDIVGAFTTFVGGVITFGEVLTTVVVGALRGFAGLADGVNYAVFAIIASYAAAAKAASIAFGWIPGIGPKLQAASTKFDEFAMKAKDGIGETGDKARGLADTIEGKMTPALDAARSGMEKMSRIEIDKARNRDAAQKVANAVERIGTNADGSQVKIKKFGDISKLSADKQAELRKRIKDAAVALGEQVDASQDAGDGQKELTKTWETGKKKLYDEFIQMGLSKKEAQKLADKYAGIKPKVSTKVEQPGMDAAQRKTKELDVLINRLNDKSIMISYSTNAEKMALKWRMNQASAVSPGLKQNAAGGTIRGPGSGTSDSILGIDKDSGVPTSWVSNDEEVVRATSARANRAALKVINAGNGKKFDVHPVGAHATGGTVGRKITENVRSDISMPNFNAMTNRIANEVGGRLGKGIERRLDALRPKDGVQPIDMANPRGRMSWNGHTFSNLFAANLRAAEKAAGARFQIYQGGFRPRTSYSGTSHQGDAIDAKVNGALIKASRARGIPMWDRTGKGNWVSHMHGIPLPGAGYPAGSAVWQGQDYKRGGDGLHTGTRNASAGFHWTAEKEAELVLNPQFRKYAGGETVLNGKQTRAAMSNSGPGIQGVEGMVKVVMPAVATPEAASAAAGGSILAAMSASGLL